MRLSSGLEFQKQVWFGLYMFLKGIVHPENDKSVILYYSKVDPNMHDFVSSKERVSFLCTYNKSYWLQMILNKSWTTLWYFLWLQSPFIVILWSRATWTTSIVWWAKKKSVVMVNNTVRAFTCVILKIHFLDTQAVICFCLSRCVYVLL